jgi:hypothetical protein
MKVRAFDELWVVERSGDSRLPARSHSGPLQPILCFKEPEGKFGKIVQKNNVKTIQDFKLKNIFVEASTSGKMARSHLRRFYEQVLGENTDETAFCPVDSWAGHKDPETMKPDLPSKNVDVLLVSHRTEFLRRLLSAA